MEWLRGLDVLQRHCIENSKQIFLEMKLRGLAPNSDIHVSVSDRPVYFAAQSWEYKSLTDT
jgi:hypothetical protein